jgi:hypothetical protein
LGGALTDGSFMSFALSSSGGLCGFALGFSKSFAGFTAFLAVSVGFSDIAGSGEYDFRSKSSDEAG